VGKRAAHTRGVNLQARGLSKYRNVPTVVDGKRFPSKREAKRYGELRFQQDATGLIADLQTQVRYRIEVNGVKVCDYVADFVYRDLVTGETVVEDCKGFRTDVYKLKAKLMKAVHGITIRET
jgi:hypothetical protein